MKKLIAVLSFLLIQVANAQIEKSLKITGIFTNSEDSAIARLTKNVESVNIVSMSFEPQPLTLDEYISTIIKNTRYPFIELSVRPGSIDSINCSIETIICYNFQHQYVRAIDFIFKHGILTDVMDNEFNPDFLKPEAAQYNNKKSR